MPATAIRVGDGLHQQIERVAGAGGELGCADQSDGGDSDGGHHAAPGPGLRDGGRGSSRLLRDALAEQALRADQQDQQQQREGESILVGDGDVGRAHRLRDAQARPPMMAPGMLPKPPMMLAAKALRATTAPIWTLTNRTGATRMPAMPPRAAE